MAKVLAKCSICLVLENNTNSYQENSDELFLIFSLFKVLRNDVMSHVRTMESLNQAGRALLEVGSGDSPHGLQSRLEELNESWEFVRCETERRQLELENRLSQVGRPYLTSPPSSLGYTWKRYCAMSPPCGHHQDEKTQGLLSLCY